MRLPAGWVRVAAGMVFIGEGVAILARPGWTITQFCRTHRWATVLINAALDLHWNGE